MNPNLWPNFRDEEFENISQSFNKEQPGSIVVECSHQVPWVAGSNLDKVWSVLCGQVPGSVTIGHCDSNQ